VFSCGGGTLGLLWLCLELTCVSACTSASDPTLAFALWLAGVGLEDLNTSEEEEDEAGSGGEGGEGEGGSRHRRPQDADCAIQ